MYVDTLSEEESDHKNLYWIFRVWT